MQCFHVQLLTRHSRKEYPRLPCQYFFTLRFPRPAPISATPSFILFRIQVFCQLFSGEALYGIFDHFQGDKPAPGGDERIFCDGQVSPQPHPALLYEGGTLCPKWLFAFEGSHPLSSNLAIALATLEVLTPTCRAISAIDKPNSSTPRFAIPARIALALLRASPL
jgi:hypothetical protein